MRRHVAADSRWFNPRACNSPPPCQHLTGPGCRPRVPDASLAGGGSMTTRVFTSPMFLGFDHLEQVLERAAKTSSDGYPPYNIEQTGPNGLRITLAVAAFTMHDLQLTQEDNQLVIRRRQAGGGQGRVFRGRCIG